MRATALAAVVVTAAVWASGPGGAGREGRATIERPLAPGERAGESGVSRQGPALEEAVAELRSEGRRLSARLAELERAGEILVAAGTVRNGERVPLPNDGRWRDGSEIEPGQWIVAVSPASQTHTWRGTPKASHCTIDQGTRVATVYTEKWTYPGEGVDGSGVAGYLIVCSRQIEPPDGAADVF